MQYDLTLSCEAQACGSCVHVSHTTATIRPSLLNSARQLFESQSTGEQVGQRRDFLCPLNIHPHGEARVSETLRGEICSLSVSVEWLFLFFFFCISVLSHVSGMHYS